LMSIPETFHFDNRGEVEKHPSFKRYFLAMVIILVALLAFGVGRLTGSERPGVSIDIDKEFLAQDGQGGAGNTAIAGASAGQVTASSQGTRYYYSHCGNSISEKNRVVFATASLAETAGYTLAKNCVPKSQ
jgi:hypothetical protein